MSILYLSLGICLFIFTVLDIIKTTLTSNGGGTLTSFLAKTVWKFFFFASGKNGKSKLLGYAGPSILVIIVMAWVLGLWLGFFLILLSDQSSISNSKTLAPANWQEKLYYAGFTLPTLGLGDFNATSNFWRVLTAVFAFSGLAFITSSITYLLPVLTAVNLQNRISLYITSMGNSPQAILIKSWNGKDFSAFFDLAPDLGDMIMKHTLDHHAYPVIYYFHNSEEKLSIKKALVTLDETLQLLTCAVLPEVSNNQVKISLLRTALDSYMETVKEYLQIKMPHGENAPAPNFNTLRMNGIPLSNGSSSYLTEQDIKSHRELLTTLLKSGGWSWQNIYPSEQKE